MSFTTPAAIASGKRYVVREVAGRPPEDLSDFEPAEVLVLDMDGTDYVLRGCGRLVGDGVRFHEKDTEHSGKDIRVWSVTREEDGTFLATHAAAF